MYRRKIAAVLLVIVLLLSISGCKTTSGEVITKKESVVLTVLAGQSTSDAGVEDMIDEKIAKAFPNVRLEWECVDWGENFDSDIRARFASGDIPDIMIGKSQDVLAYAGTGNLAPISIECVEGIRKEALDAVSIDGVPYGMPYTALYQGVIYNKDIFEKYNLSPPNTVEELDTVIATLKQNGIIPFASHFQESWKIGNMTMQYLTNDIFNHEPDWGDKFRDNQVNFSDSNIIKKCLLNNKKIMEASWEDALHIDQFECDYRFEQGQAAMYLTGLWSMQFTNQYAGGSDFGIFPYPNQTGDACLIRETNMTFMKSAMTANGKLIDEIFRALLTDHELMKEILDFTQTSPVVDAMTNSVHNSLQTDIDKYQKENKIVEVESGNSQLVWSYQNDLAEQQLLWLQGKQSLDDVLAYADAHRAESINPIE